MRRCEREERGRKEHCFVIGVSDEEADAFFGELGVGISTYVGGEEPYCGNDDGKGKDGVDFHDHRQGFYS